tara:strand:- start:294 stop:575 length:282 start_codon:yes stop_codon:yes gene_type:complete
VLHLKKARFLIGPGLLNDPRISPAMLAPGNRCQMIPVSGGGQDRFDRGCAARYFQFDKRLAVQVDNKQAWVASLDLKPVRNQANGKAGGRGTV